MGLGSLGKAIYAGAGGSKGTGGADRIAAKNAAKGSAPTSGSSAPSKGGIDAAMSSVSDSGGIGGLMSKTIGSTLDGKGSSAGTTNIGSSSDMDLSSEAKAEPQSLTTMNGSSSNSLQMVHGDELSGMINKFNSGKTGNTGSETPTSGLGGQKLVDGTLPELAGGTERLSKNIRLSGDKKKPGEV